ncbi:MAG: LexA family transcriptional regulator [Magnetospiraceae bacterium]
MIKKRLELGLSQAELGRRCGEIPQQSIAQLEAGEVRNPRYLVELADVLETTVDWLRTGAGDPDRHYPGLDVPPADAMPRDIPVRGSAEGGDGEHFEIGDVVDYARRPPGLRNVRNVYALYVTGESMVPRFEPGDLIFVHPDRPPSPGCDVVIQMHDHTEIHRAMVKRLVRRNASALIVAQFNPAREITLDPREVQAVHRVLSTAELLGL